MNFLGPVTTLGGAAVRPHDIEILTLAEPARVPATVLRLVRLGFEVRVTPWQAGRKTSGYRFSAANPTGSTRAWALTSSSARSRPAPRWPPRSPPPADDDSSSARKPQRSRSGVRVDRGVSRAAVSDLGLTWRPITPDDIETLVSARA